MTLFHQCHPAHLPQCFLEAALTDYQFFTNLHINSVHEYSVAIIFLIIFNSFKMKNITFSADESLIRKAREKATEENSSLNIRFREWLEKYASRKGSESDYRMVMNKIGYASPGKKFTRDELNER